MNKIFWMFFFITTSFFNMSNSNAGIIYATAVDWVNNGTTYSANDRDNPLNALGAPDGAFLSLGLTPDQNILTDNAGFAVFSFGQTFSGNISLWEITFNCVLGGIVCDIWPEAVDVYVGQSYNFGSHDIDDVLDDFQRIGQVTNGVAQYGTELSITDNFTYLALIDVSEQFNGPSSEGWDVDAIGVTAVPEPSSLSLFGLSFIILCVSAKRRAQK